MIIAGGKGKPPKPSEMDMGEEEMSEKEPSGDEETLAANAFQAIKDDDEEGFKRSFKAAVRACLDSYGEE